MTNKAITPILRFPNFIEEWIDTPLLKLSGKPSYGMNASSKEFDGKHIYLRITDIDETTHELLKTNLTSPDAILSEEFKLTEGDLLFTRTGSSTGKTYLYKKEDGDLFFAGFLIKFHIDDAIPGFVCYYTQTSQYRKWVNINSMRSGQPGINAHEYSKLLVPTPTHEEQKKITSFLHTLDEWIKALRKQKVEFQRYKKVVNYQIFNQEIRFKDEIGKDYPSWEKKKLGKLFHERNEKNGTSQNQLLSVKTRGGVVLQSEISKTDSSNSDKRKYKVVGVGDIAYNTMRMWQGASGVSQYEGIVSPAYTVVYPKNGDTNFYGYLLKHPRTIFNFYRYSQGLTSDTWNLKFKHFSEVEVTVPSDLEEQKKIAAFLSSLDELIEHKEKQIALAEQWKKGLLQKMFV